MPAIVTIRAHAKVNLDLRVLGTRADGFHELRTVFQALALRDGELRAGVSFFLTCSFSGQPG